MNHSPPKVDSEMRKSYERDVVVLVRQALAQEWVEKMNQFAEGQISAPGQWANDQPEETDAGGRMFTDRYLWRTNTLVRDFAFDSGVAALVGQLMGSQTARLYFDHLLIKEPGTLAPTPWHQDAPYWPFTGKQIASTWVALSDVTIRGSAMEFVRRSHSDGRTCRPEIFGGPSKSDSVAWLKKSNAEPVLEIEAHREDFDITGWDMRAGDAVIFSAYTLHGAPDRTRRNCRRGVRNRTTSGHADSAYHCTARVNALVWANAQHLSARVNQ